MQKRNVVVADEPGLGKTIQSIAGVVGAKIRGSVLIIAPKSAAYLTWPLELSRWLSDISPEDPVRIIGSHLDKRGRLKVVRETIEWHMQYRHDLQDPESKPYRQWIVLSPNYLRFKAELDNKNRYVRDANGDKIIHVVREAIKPLLAVEWSAVIVDEAHETLAGATGAPKKWSAQSTGIRLLDVREDGLKIALSGTPFRGKHENLWGLANWVDPVTYPSGEQAGGKGKLPYWRWIHKHFEVFHDDTYDTDIIGNLRSERELAREAKSYMIRRTKKKVLSELPDKLPGGAPRYPDKKPPEDLTDALHEALREQRLIYAKEKPVQAEIQAARANAQMAQDIVNKWYDENNPVAVWLPMEGPQKRAYEQMKKEAQANIEGGVLLANSVLAEMTRLRQFANSAGKLDDQGNYHPAFPSNKFDWLLQFLMERGFGDGKPTGSRIVIASQFTKHINMFAQELRSRYNMQCYLLTGATSAVHRMQYVEEFQSGTTRAGGPSPELFLLNTKAGGVGITLDAADDLVVLDRTHNIDDQIQLEDRIHRISRIHQVTIWDVISKGTIDEKIFKVTKATGRSLGRILNTPADALALLDS